MSMSVLLDGCYVNGSRQNLFIEIVSRMMSSSVRQKKRLSFTTMIPFVSSCCRIRFTMIMIVFTKDLKREDPLTILFKCLNLYLLISVTFLLQNDHVNLSAAKILFPPIWIIQPEID